MEKDFKIKPLTKGQIIISLDRLTRFKPTEEKYLRVFKEIILSNLICPKYKKNELELMDYMALTELFEMIFNFSLNQIMVRDIYPLSHQQKSVNKKLFNYEKSVFKFDKNVEKLLNNNIDYESSISLIYNDDVVTNLKWLKSLVKNADQIKNRANFGLKFPLEKIILAEGITEEILLPKFARIYGFDFDKEGIHLISAGGKNQVVRLFYQFADILKLPIFVLLDNDAKANYEEIKPKLRNNDKIYILNEGEFEDILPLTLIKRTINKNFKEYFSVSLNDLRKDKPMTRILEELFKSHGLEFKKAEFATLIKENVHHKKDISEEIENIFTELNLI